MILILPSTLVPSRLKRKVSIEVYNPLSTKYSAREKSPINDQIQTDSITVRAAFKLKEQNIPKNVLEVSLLSNDEFRHLDLPIGLPGVVDGVVSFQIVISRGRRCQARRELGGGWKHANFSGLGQPFLGLTLVLCVKNNNDDYCFLLWVKMKPQIRAFISTHSNKCCKSHYNTCAWAVDFSEDMMIIELRLLMIRKKK